MNTNLSSLAVFIKGPDDVLCWIYYQSLNHYCSGCPPHPFAGGYSLHSRGGRSEHFPTPSVHNSQFTILAWACVLFRWQGVGLVTPSVGEGQTAGKSIVSKRLSLPAAFLYARSPGTQNGPDSSQKYRCCTTRLNLLSKRFADTCFQKQESDIWC